MVYVALRRAGADGAVLEAAVLVALLSVPATALGFLVGLVQWRIYSGGASAADHRAGRDARTRRELRGLLARALEEPARELYYADPAAGRGRGAPAWHDSSGGAALRRPGAPPARCLHEAEAESGLRVALVCEEGFGDRPGFLDAVCACVVSGLERQRLDAALADSLADVAASRKRLVGAADGARQKIERDLHDGAQQQLVALRVKLELAREALEQESGEAAEMVAGLGPEVEEIIEEVRSLARGIYPALLASDGLGEALRAAGRRSAVPVTIERRRHRPAALGDRERRLLLLPRGAAERRQARRRGEPRSGSGCAATASSASRSPTTAAASPPAAPTAAPGSPGCATASPRSAASSGSSRRPARAPGSAAASRSTARSSIPRRRRSGRLRPVSGKVRGRPWAGARLRDAAISGPAETAREKCWRRH